MILRRFRANVGLLRDQPDYGESEDGNPFARVASEGESHGCLMAVCPDEFDGIIKNAADKVEANALVDEEWAEGGISDKAHVTLKYGICEDSEKVLKWCSDNLIKPFSFRFTAADIFENEDKWVLVMLCDKEELGEINKNLCKSIPHVDSEFEDYKPHMTICYVKPETDCNEAVKFLNDTLSGREVEITEVEYSDADDKTTKLKL